MTTTPDEPRPDVDLEPAAEPADAAEQQRDAWQNEDELIVPDPERPVPIDEEEAE
ncbi:hypothetical protein AFL01nite_15470 [Aeromicrobium flavum]|uniref:Uncharacterized protein n=1 Tax=Aeromicrobium flavum TaxID=416568 RepID=A0A512HUX9_9ACTN|nr:hypothetical protein [Aeromicrobium flavum]GEO89220.1 hypothetical protein AFL01nite_15470 [Aeromicrobium flavum]